MAGVISDQIQTALVEEQIQSEFILKNLHSHTITNILYRDPTDFMHGREIRIPAMGDATIDTWDPKNGKLVPKPIQMGEVLFRLTDDVGHAWSYREDEVNEFGRARINHLLTHHPQDFLRLYQQRTESRMFETLNDAQTVNNPNEINGQSHRFVAAKGSDTNRQLGVQDFKEMRTAFQKAYAPNALVAFIDPVAEEQVMNDYTTTISNDANPQIQALLNDGSFRENHRFVGNIYGWNTFVSNFTPEVTDTSITHRGVARGLTGTKQKRGAVFLSIENDNTKALLYQERTAPNVKGDYSHLEREWSYSIVAKQGYGIQRVDTIGIVAHHI